MLTAAMFLGMAGSTQIHEIMRLLIIYHRTGFPTPVMDIPSGNLKTALFTSTVRARSDQLPNRFGRDEQLLDALAGDPKTLTNRRVRVSSQTKMHDLCAPVLAVHSHLFILYHDSASEKQLDICNI